VKAPGKPGLAERDLSAVVAGTPDDWKRAGEHSPEEEAHAIVSLVERKLVEKATAGDLRLLARRQRAVAEAVDRIADEREAVALSRAAYAASKVTSLAEYFAASPPTFESFEARAAERIKADEAKSGRKSRRVAPDEEIIARTCDPRLTEDPRYGCTCIGFQPARAS